MVFSKTTHTLLNAFKTASEQLLAGLVLQMTNAKPSPSSPTKSPEPLTETQPTPTTGSTLLAMRLL